MRQDQEVQLPDLVSRVLSILIPDRPPGMTTQVIIGAVAVVFNCVVLGAEAQVLRLQRALIVRLVLRVNWWQVL